MEISSTNPIPPTKYALGQGDSFPTTRRLKKQEISTNVEDVVNKWFEFSKIQIGPIADIPERVAKAKRLFYIWKGCFAENVCDIKAIDLIEHFIDLVPETQPVMGKVPKYTTTEHAFANEIFLQMEDAEIITQRSSLWE